MPIALNSLMVGYWTSLLSNLGGTSPDPTLGRSARVEGSPEGEGELTSATEHGPPLHKVHQRFRILSNATEIV